MFDGTLETNRNNLLNLSLFWRNNFYFDKENINFFPRSKETFFL